MNGNGSSLAVELDEATVQVVTQLAETWGVSKPEAVRRAVEQAERAERPSAPQDRLSSFRALQERLQLTPAKAAEWQAAVREARR